MEVNSDEKPLKNENVRLDVVTEGKASVKLSNQDNTFSAFYNPSQELNRDLSVLAINTFFDFNKFRKDKERQRLEKDKFAICECLSATGLRAIRYYLELDRDKIRQIVANDMDKKAVECIEQNIVSNSIDRGMFQSAQKEASQLLYLDMKNYEIIDLDPYGTAIPMIDAGIQSVKSDGLLCVTFTDMPVLCGNYPETTHYKYGSIPYKTPFCHEMAKRIALFAISSSASKYKKVIKPLLSYNAEFYIRLFLVVKDSAEDCKRNGLKYGYMYHCRNCQNRVISPLSRKEKITKKEKQSEYYKFNNLIGPTDCEVCDSKMCQSGPYWIDDLHDIDFVERLSAELKKDKFSHLKFGKRIDYILQGIKNEESLKKCIFSYDYSRLASDISLSSFRLPLFRGALNNLSYSFVQSYYDPNLFKTDCPPATLYDIFKKYKRENYGDNFMKNVKEESYKHKILSKEIKCNPTFVELKDTSANKMKFLPNPTPNWGPKAKAKVEKYVNKIIKLK